MCDRSLSYRIDLLAIVHLDRQIASSNTSRWDCCVSENHALLDAEGVPAESFFPQNEDRMAYDNGAEYEELYPHGSKLMLWPLDYPRVSSKNKVPRFVSQKLMQIAGQLEGADAHLSA